MYAAHALFVDGINPLAIPEHREEGFGMDDDDDSDNFEAHAAYVMPPERAMCYDPSYDVAAAAMAQGVQIPLPVPPPPNMFRPGAGMPMQMPVPIPPGMPIKVPLPPATRMHKQSTADSRRRRRRQAGANAAMTPGSSSSTGEEYVVLRRKGEDHLNPEILQELQNRSSEDIMRMMTDLKAAEQITDDEYNQLRIVLRQVKNRESANRSRKRRNDHLLNTTSRVEYEKAKNAKLLQYAHDLQALLRQHGIEYPPEPTFEPFQPPIPLEPKPIRGGVRTAGICIMAVLFAVSLLCNAMHGMGTATATSQTLTLVPTDAAAAAAATASVPGTPPGADPAIGPMADAFVGRDSQVAVVSAKPEVPDTPKPPVLADPGALAKYHHHAGAAGGEPVRRTAYLTYDTDKEDSSRALVERYSSPSPPPAERAHKRLVVPPSPRTWDYTTRAIFGRRNPHVAGSSWKLDNTSYILVNDATEFVPANAMATDGQAEPVIGLLVPAAALNITNSAPGDVVEILCGVRNANVVPREVLASSFT